jgi:hypothetical protein
MTFVVLVAHVLEGRRLVVQVAGDETKILRRIEALWERKLNREVLARRNDALGVE